MKSPNWLHGRVAAVAQRCVGVDVLPDGVAAMLEQGYEVVVQDLGAGLGELADIAPFDVIVAGELIEHVEALNMLFDVAAEALAPGGQLVITTPNPYAPHRVRAAQLGIVWENVDHIVYAFPSGIAELAERHGLVLTEAATTDDRRPAGSVTDRLRAVKRRLRGRQWRNVGYASLGQRGVRAVSFGPIGAALRAMRLPQRRFLGETFIYVVERPA
jgi:SAM-dependent methyltransferase